METIRHYLLIIAARLIGAIVFIPCFLTFTKGSEGQPTIVNLIGFAYSVALVLTVRYILKK